MTGVSRVLVVASALALGACGSVQSSGSDASARGGSGGSNGGGGAQGGSAAGGSPAAGNGGTSAGGGTAGSPAGTGGTNGGRGGAGGAAGASGSSGGAARGGSSGQGGGGRGGSGGAAGVVGTCGGQICGIQDVCCGPAECPRCMNIPSNLCPTTCGGAGGASAGRGGGGGSAGRGGAGGGSGGRGGASGGSGGAGGGPMPCETDAVCQGFKCCAGVCVNPGNDVFNCGTCGNICSGAHPYCGNGTCRPDWPCTLVGAACAEGPTCCGGACCTGTQICCTVTQGPTVTGCFEPVNGRCPTGCSACACAAPKTPIATPTGDRPIADLKVGDLVYSVDHGSLAIVPIRQVHRQPVTGSHRVVELKLGHGATLRISPRHPTADGRHFSDLVVGDLVDGVRVTAVSLVDYDQPFTHDILPDSDSGTYFAGGTLIGSTLSARFGDAEMTTAAATTSVRRASVIPSDGR